MRLCNCYSNKDNKKLQISMILTSDFGILYLKYNSTSVYCSNYELFSDEPEEDENPSTFAILKSKMQS